MDYLKIWDVILRRRRIIFYIFMSFFVPVLVGTFVIKKSYQAESRLLVKQSDNFNSILKNLGILSITMTSANSSTSTSSYDTDITLSTSMPLLKKLISQLDLKASDGEPMEPKDMTTGKIKKYFMPAPHVESEQDDDADILLITGTATTAQQAADIANKTALLYIEETKNRLENEYQQVKSAIDAQIENVESDYRDALNNMQNDMVKNQYVDISIETQSLVDAIQKVNTSILEIERDIAAAQKKENEIKRQLINTNKFRVEYEEYKENKQLSDLKTKLNDRLVSIAGKAVEKRPEHPDYKLLESESEAAKNIIKQEVDLLLDAKKSSIDPVYANLELSLSQNSIDLMTAVAKRKIYNDFLNSYKKELLTLPVKKVSYQQLDLDITLTKTLLTDMRTALKKMAVAEKLRLTNISLIEPAEVPKKQNFPNKAINLIFGFVFGLLFGITAAFFMESIDNTIHEAMDFKRFDSLNYLGAIVKSRELTEKKLISNIAPLSPIVEEFRAIRNAIRYATVDSPIKTITVTGSIAEEGVSTIAANLAISLSMDGCRVVLVEMNLRQPRLSEYFKVTAQQGVAGVLTNIAELHNAITRSGVKGVDLLLADSEAPYPGNLAGVKDMLRTLSLNYDVVILDAPPTIPVNDSVEIGRNTDRTILVTEASKTTYSMIEQSVNKLEKAGISLLGVVINKKQHSGSRYYTYFSPKKDKYCA